MITGWSRSIQIHHPVILPRSSWGTAGIWHHKEGNI